MKDSNFDMAHAAWGAIAAYEVTCPPGQTLSEGLDRYVDSENKLVKWGTRMAIGYTALHMMNLLPNQIDIFYHLGKIKEKILESTFLPL